MKVGVRPSARFAEYVRKIACDEWEFVGTSGGDKGILRHKSGATVAYGLHDGGNDWNGPRNFATEVQRICGCRLIEHRGRKRSRKSAPGADPQVEASRRRHAAEFAAKAEERERQRAQEEQRRLAAERAAADDRRRREIEGLMR